MTERFWRVVKNTVRVKWMGAAGDFPQREEFVRNFVIQKFKLTYQNVLGIQRNGREEFMDIAFRGPGPFNAFLAQIKAMEEDLGPYQVESLERQNHRVVIINMFDMNLPAESVTRFLAKYARVVRGPKYRRDAFGFWNGHRVYEVLLQESDHEFQGYLHPPALCQIEGVKGHVMYSWQPPFCRRCMEDHLIRACPEHQCSYADALRGERSTEPGPAEKTPAGAKEKTVAEEAGGATGAQHGSGFGAIRGHNVRRETARGEGDPRSRAGGERGGTLLWSQQRRSGMSRTPAQGPPSTRTRTRCRQLMKEVGGNSWKV
ncbi:hypothetical protein SKAU_G00387290 [Synaphobranchus kaupii]|uniref:Uncharacterized protein n=1 Tax=Synaphobranchus kaupii TaxID=118154 RepID=A0A9Q1ID99_SYNKA|nr:hypothetical protein SKAU_G00387290 [Synaphobranchus kaupii]